MGAPFARGVGKTERRRLGGCRELDFDTEKRFHEVADDEGDGSDAPGLVRIGAPIQMR
jgi:hypothetical protein